MTWSTRRRSKRARRLSDDLQPYLHKFEEGAQSVGKDPARMPRIIELSVAFTNDVDSAVKDMKRYWGGALVPALYDQKIYTPTMAAQNGQVIGGDIIRQHMVISTEPDEHVMFVMPYIELGFDTLIFHSPQSQQRKFIETYGREVLPLLRGRAKREVAMVSGAAGHKGTRARAQ